MGVATVEPFGDTFTIDELRPGASDANKLAMLWMRRGMSANMPICITSERSKILLLPKAFELSDDTKRELADAHVSVRLYYPLK